MCIHFFAELLTINLLKSHHCSYIWIKPFLNVIFARFKSISTPLVRGLSLGSHSHQANVECELRATHGRVV